MKWPITRSSLIAMATGGVLVIAGVPLRFIVGVAIACAALYGFYCMMIPSGKENVR